MMLPNFTTKYQFLLVYIAQIYRKLYIKTFMHFWAHFHHPKQKTEVLIGFTLHLM